MVEGFSVGPQFGIPPHNIPSSTILGSLLSMAISPLLFGTNSPNLTAFSQSFSFGGVATHFIRYSKLLCPVIEFVFFAH